MNSFENNRPVNKPSSKNSTRKKRSTSDDKARWKVFHFFRVGNRRAAVFLCDGKKKQDVQGAERKENLLNKTDLMSSHIESPYETRVDVLLTTSTQHNQNIKNYIVSCVIKWEH